MNSIVDLNAFRDRHGYDGLICACGSAWFYLLPVDGTPAAVCLDKDRGITGYSGALVCIECEARL